MCCRLRTKTLHKVHKNAEVSPSRRSTHSLGQETGGRQLGLLPGPSEHGMAKLGKSCLMVV